MLWMMGAPHLSDGSEKVDSRQPPAQFPPASRALLLNRDENEIFWCRRCEIFSEGFPPASRSRSGRFPPSYAMVFPNRSCLREHSFCSLDDRTWSLRPKRSRMVVLSCYGRLLSRSLARPPGYRVPLVWSCPSRPAAPARWKRNSGVMVGLVVLLLSRSPSGGL